jgi:enoyl-[acyl-carrier-protein] reductase (NADH)
MSLQIPRPALRGKKALVIGIANEYSIALGLRHGFP